MKPGCPGGQCFGGVRPEDVHVWGDGGDMQGGRQQRFRNECQGSLDIKSSGVSLSFHFLVGCRVQDLRRGDLKISGLAQQWHVMHLLRKISALLELDRGHVC